LQSDVAEGKEEHIAIADCKVMRQKEEIGQINIASMLLSCPWLGWLTQLPARLLSS
jgi:hypothetical protein